MRLSISWLKNYVSVPASIEEIAHKLTMAGLEVKNTEKLPNGSSVFELEITPNRPDCLSVIGIAREAAAVFNKPLNIPPVSKIKFPKTKCDVSIQDKSGCLRYIGIVVKDVRVQSPSADIAQCLSAVGLRVVNNIVDITNFCLHETGQPLHAFDYDKLIGGKVIVRRAKEGETITTIDGIERKLNPSILVIADEKRPVAVAGVMGGKDTEVTSATKNILLESAYFDPLVIRRGARALGLSSDSSYRFERGVDMENVASSALRAISLILRDAGGTIEAFRDFYPKKIKTFRNAVTISRDKINKSLGADIPLSRSKLILGKLGFKVTSKKDMLTAFPPSFRNDVSQDVDLIEEIARVVGYDASPVSLPQIKASTIAEDSRRSIKVKLSSAFLACGFHEAIHYSMVSLKAIEKSGLSPKNLLRVQNPLSAEQEIMRPSLLPGFLTSVFTNFSRGQKDIRLFEIGKIYAPSDPMEKDMLGLIMTGRQSADWRRLSKEEVDFYDIKGALEKAFDVAGLGRLGFKPFSAPFLTEEKNASVLFQGKTIGFVGNVSERVLSQWDIKQKNVLIAQIDLETIYNHPKKDIFYKNIPEFPAIVRDISLAVKGEVSYEDICAAAGLLQCDFLRDIRLVEQYIGDKIPKGYRGLVVSLTYQSPVRTLREEEVNQVHDRFCREVVEKFGAIRR